jgi:hypothetical protein
MGLYQSFYDGKSHTGVTNTLDQRIVSAIQARENAG